MLHLPVIVESAESSPGAAASAALQIRKFLGRDYGQKPHVQYNAIMLIRILCDNPGATFTRNFDKSFVNTVKELLRSCKDNSTQQIMRETLDSLEADKGYDEGLQGLLQMWRKEKGQGASMGHSRSARQSQQPHTGYQQQPYQPVYPAQGGGGGSGSRQTTQLPSAVELASRVEEAKNTAKILLQLVQSTPTEEILPNELIREFSERCQGAQRSMQGYINCNNPPLDHDTMQTLIETNEQLSLAISRYQRAVLGARRAMGATPSPNNAASGNGQGSFAPPPVPSSMPPPHQTANIALQTPATTTNGFASYGATAEKQYNHSSPQSYEGYQAPPGPPPSMTTSLQRRNTPQNAAYSPDHQDQRNPFADPADQNENARPLAIEPQNFGGPAFSQQEQSRQQPYQSFSIEPEPTFAPPRRQNTADLENAYSDTDSRVSPVYSRGSGAPSDGFVSPQSATRPKPGPWHNSEITQSYMGRQASATNHLTMHGAQDEDDDNDDVAEHNAQYRRRG